MRLCSFVKIFGRQPWPHVHPANANMNVALINVNFLIPFTLLNISDHLVHEKANNSTSPLGIGKSSP